MKDTEYLVSIRCLTYNHARYITDAMNGFCMQQTSFPFVALIVDDASTDGEQDVIKEYLDKHFDMLTAQERETEDAFFIEVDHKENKFCHFVVVLLKKNLYHIKSKKLSLVSKWEDNVKYRAGCEGDDYWTDPLKLQKQVKYMEEHKECCMTACAADWVKEGKLFKNDSVSDESRDLTTDEVILGGGGYLATCSLVYDNSKLNGVIPKWRKNANVGDYPLQIQGTLEGKLHYFPDTMCVYRYGCPGSWTSINLGEDKQCSYDHWKKEIDWMMELDNATQKKYKSAICQHLKCYFSELYPRRMATLKDYLYVVFSVGSWHYYKRMIKDVVKRIFNYHYEM